MAADYRLKQNLKMSLNSQIKNLIPELLTDVPPEDEWTVGRLWFNSTIGKYQGVFVKLDSKTGKPSIPEEKEVRILGADELGPTSDGEYWPDGLFNFNPSTKISDAMDEVNEALKDLAPAEATTLRGDLSLSVPNGLKSGRVAKLNGNEPDLLRTTGFTVGQTINYIIIDDNLSATLPTVGFVIKSKQQNQFGKADQGKIAVFYDNSMVDTGIDLFKEFNEASRDYYGVEQGFLPEVNQTITNIDGTTETIVANPNKTNYRSTTQTLTINTVERYNDFKKWQRGVGELNFGKLNGQSKITPGFHTFYVEHSNVLGGSYKTNTSNIFYDPNKTLPISTITKLTLKTSTLKSISGISFNNSNITFDVSLKATDVFSYTYWDKPISLSATGTNATTIDWNHTTSNLKDLTTPFWDSIIEINDYLLTYTAQNSFTDNVVLSMKAGKVATGWGVNTTQTLKLLIDTTPLSNNSTLLKETFNDEYYRLSSNLDFSNAITVKSEIGKWDSTILLSMGNAQQYFGHLVVAQMNYSEFNLNVDYTSFANDTQYYYRPIIAEGKSNSNGTLKITTTNTIGTGKDIEIYIKFPTLTGWLDITKLYDSQFFNNNLNVDGTGCATAIRVTSSSVECDWTIGTNSTFNSNFMYTIKVVMKNKLAKINEIEEISSTWR